MAKDAPGKTPAPKKPGRIAQIRQVYTQSKQVDPRIGWWMLGAFLLVLLVVVGIGWLLGAPVYAAILGLPLGLLAATLVMSRRAERAAYRQIEGQPGAVGAALTALRRGWYTDPQPVAVEAARGGDMTESGLVFRAVGRPGVVLVGEGPTGRAQKALAAERRKLERVVPGVPITVYRVGEGTGNEIVTIRKLAARGATDEAGAHEGGGGRDQQAPAGPRRGSAAAAAGLRPDEGPSGPPGDARSLSGRQVRRCRRVPRRRPSTARRRRPLP